MLTKIPEDSLAAMCGRLSVLTDGAIKAKPGYTVYESAFSMFYSRHMITAENDTQAASIVAAICRDIDQGVPRLVSYTEEISGPGFGAELSKRGFINIIVQDGMLIDISKQTLSAEPDPNISLIGSEDLDEWSKTCEIAFGKPSELPSLQWFIKDSQCRFYAYKLDGKIVGTAMTYAQDGNSGIHEVGTLPAYRGRGICSKLVARAMVDAQADGDRIVSLQASEAGAKVYAKAGMQKVSVIRGWMKFN